MTCGWLAAHWSGQSKAILQNGRLPSQGLMKRVKPGTLLRRKGARLPSERILANHYDQILFYSASHRRCRFSMRRISNYVHTNVWNVLTDAIPLKAVWLNHHGRCGIDEYLHLYKGKCGSELLLTPSMLGYIIPVSIGGIDDLMDMFRFIMLVCKR